MVKNEDGTVTLTADEYDELVEDQDFLDCLRGAGVDNWDGWDYAIEAYQEQHPDDEDQLMPASV